MDFEVCTAVSDLRFEISNLRSGTLTGVVAGIGAFYANIPKGHPLQHPQFTQASRVHGGRSGHARCRHRRQHYDLQHHQRPLTEATAVS